MTSQIKNVQLEFDRLRGCRQNDDILDDALWDMAYVNVHGRVSTYTTECERGAPQRVKDACWREAMAKCNKGKNSKQAVQDEYCRRLTAYKSRITEKQVSVAAENGDKKIQIAADAHAARQLAAEFAADERRWGKTPIREPRIVELEDVTAIPDSWEDTSLPSICDSQWMTKKSIEVEHEKTPLKFEVPHGHPVLAASRTYGDRQLRQRGASECVAVALKEPHKRAAVMDLGSGAAGIKASLKFIKELRDTENVYFHCCFPIACSADLNREASLTPIRDQINWIQETGVPMRERVNVCRHRASECDCFMHYTHRYVMAVHSAYYFTACDWANVFKYVDVVHTFTHTPGALDRPTPGSHPEFVWTKVTTAKTSGWHERVLSALRTHVVGCDDYLVFEPVNSHGTTYTQVDPRIEIEAGGFHLRGSFRNWLQHASHSLPCLAGAVAAQAAGVAAVGLGILEAIATRSPKPLVKAVVLGMALTTPVQAMRVANNAYTANAAFCAERTVRIDNNTALSYDGEEIAHFFDYRVGVPQRLERRRLASYRPNSKLVRELAATGLLSKKDPETQMKVMLSRAFRDGLPEQVTVDTVNEAAAMITRVMPKNEVTPSNSSSSDPGRAAWPSAWAAPPCPTLLGRARTLPAALRVFGFASLGGAVVLSPWGISALSFPIPLLRRISSSMPTQYPTIEDLSSSAYLLAQLAVSQTASQTLPML